MSRITALALVALALLPVGSAHALDEGSLVNASGPLGLPGLGQFIPSTAGTSFTGSQGNVVTANGRYVVFRSGSDALLTPEQAATISQGIFRRDMQSNTTELVSLGVDDLPISDPNLGSPSISADGDRVAFISFLGLVPSDGNGEGDVYVRDLSDGTTFLASAKQADGTTGTGVVEDASISGNGEFVAYRSSAPNLVAGDTNGSTDAFRSCIAQVCPVTTERVSVDSNENQLDDGSFVSRPSISHDGSVIAFETNHEDADGVDPGPDDDNRGDIYARNVTAGTTVLVSRADGIGGAKASDEALFARVSAEGNLVSFLSRARDLDGAPESVSDSDNDVFVRDLVNNQTARATLTSGGAQMSGDASGAIPQTVDGDMLVAFTHPTGVFVRNLSDQQLEGPLYGAPGLSGLAGLAADAQTTVANSNDPNLSPDDDDDFGNVYARPTIAQGPRLVSRATGSSALPRGPGQSGLSFGRQLSGDGRYVAFTSHADALLPGELRSRSEQVFVRDLVTGDVTLVSRSGPAGAPGNDNSTEPQMSGDGRRVLFVTRATNLVEGLTGQQVVLRDLDAGTTSLVSAGPGGVAADAGASRASLSSDGQVAAYTSQSDNLGFGALAHAQVIVRDLRTGVQQLASATTAGTPGDSFSDLPSLDADGSRVAFSTEADNIDGDPDVDNGVVIVKDLVDASVRVASRDSSGAKLPTGGFQASLDDAGTRVAFGSSSKLDPQDDDPGGIDVAVRDLATGTTTRLSRRADGGEPSAQTSSGTISRDGRFVVFSTSANDLAADALPPADTRGEYIADLQTGAVRLVSRRADGTAVPVSSTISDVSADGRCVAFTSGARNVFGDAAGSFDFGNVLVKAMTGACPCVIAPPPVVPPVVPPVTPPSVDRTPPVMSSLSVTNKRFRRSSKATAVSAQRRRAAKRGTTFRFRLSEAATVRLVLARAERGRRVGSSCRKATAKLRKRRACTRYVTKGTLTRKLTAGAKRIAFSGRVGRKAVPLGTYRARLVATDAAGNRSAERRITVRIVRR